MSKEVLFFKDLTISPEEKNARGRVLFSVNNSFCSLRESECEMIVPPLSKAIEYTTKRDYLAYKNIDVMYPICEHFFGDEKRFYPDPQNNDIRGDFHLQFTNDRNLIFTNKYQLADHFYNWFHREEEGNQPEAVKYQRQSNLFEVLHRFYLLDERMNAIEEARYRQEQARLMRPGIMGMHHIYNDTQSVHNTVINSSVNGILETLNRKYYRFRITELGDVAHHFSGWEGLKGKWFATSGEIWTYLLPYLRPFHSYQKYFDVPLRDAFHTTKTFEEFWNQVSPRFKNDKKWYNLFADDDSHIRQKMERIYQSPEQLQNWVFERYAYLSDGDKIKWIEEHTSFANAHTTHTILDKCKIDSLLYGGVNLLQAFYLTLSYIFQYTDGELRKDTLKIYAEEMEGMKNFCGTGHVARWVAALQGIPNLPDELILKMGRMDELKGKLEYHLGKKMEDAPDEVVDDSMINGIHYIHFVFGVVAELADEEGVSLEHFLPILSNLFKKDCVVENGKLKLV